MTLFGGTRKSNLPLKQPDSQVKFTSKLAIKIATPKGICVQFKIFGPSNICFRSGWLFYFVFTKDAALESISARSESCCTASKHAFTSSWLASSNGLCWSSTGTEILNAALPVF